MVTSPEIIFVDSRMCFRVFVFVFCFFVKLVFKVKTLNFKWVHSHLRLWPKTALWQNGVLCSSHPAEDFPHFMYRYVSVLSSPTASSNVCMCLPVFDLFVVHGEKWSWTDVRWRPSLSDCVTSHLLQASCCDISLLIGNINLYLVALH